MILAIEPGLYTNRVGGIRIEDNLIVTVAPGAVVTPLNKSWTDDPQKRANVESHIPVGKAATAEEIAGVSLSWLRRMQST
jgi:NAD(P)-dependent dehydrogenase (short-subunit alcohol dehydrogenase family)